MSNTQNKSFAIMSKGKLKTQAESCREIVAGALSAALRDATPADLFVNGIFRKDKRFGSRDRHFIMQTLFAFFRWRGWLNKTFGEQDSYPPTIFRRILLAALAAEGLDMPAAEAWCDEINLSFAAYKEHLALPTPVERLNAFCGKGLEYTAHELLPFWALPELAAGNTETLIARLQKRPPMWIRSQCADPAELLNDLRQNGLTPQPHHRIPNAFQLADAKVNLYELESFRKGLFEIQDFSSQCIGLATLARPGQIWWDPCAGGGGKTLQLADMMERKGVVTASDIREYKLDDLKKRAARAAFPNIRTSKWNGRLAPGKRNLYDGVLVDAPCSSSGRWRRNPDARWIAKPEWIDELNAIQFKILSTVADAVKPGGALVYATCSMFKRENTGIVERFLLSRKDFEPEGFPNPHTGEITDGTLQTWPENADCDASFVARFKRK